MTEEEFEYCEQAERQKHDEKVKELEKENADFIKKVFKLVKINNKLKNQITEAREIIKGLLSVPYDTACITFDDMRIMDKAENFINKAENFINKAVDKIN